MLLLRLSFLLREKKHRPSMRRMKTGEMRVIQITPTYRVYHIYSRYFHPISPNTCDNKTARGTYTSSSAPSSPSSGRQWWILLGVWRCKLSSVLSSVTRVCMLLGQKHRSWTQTSLRFSHVPIRQNQMRAMNQRRFTRRTWKEAQLSVSAHIVCA